LGARVVALDVDPLDEAAVQAAAQAAPRIGVLVVDAGALAPGGPDPLRAALDGAWNLIRAVAGAHWIGHDGGGRLVVIAPHAGDPVARPAAAGLENLVRTLSTEWARHAVTTVAVLPGASTAPGELEALVAFLASPAGAYFSGCALRLR
jgi:NAD(P)-dependent dehydrogenase (short-subunit alcohol dehydrogenase family)